MMNDHEVMRYSHIYHIFIVTSNGSILQNLVLNDEGTALISNLFRNVNLLFNFRGMPTITVTKDLLYERLGTTYSDEEFEDECFDFGIELDDVVEEEGITKFKIDIPANRYDLLCVEGLSRSLNVFRERMSVPKFVVKPATLKMIVDDSVKAVRPYCLAAVLRNFTFTQEIYNSFILLQDKLHQNIGRERSLVSIGTHDLDTIQGPFKYQGISPADIKFQPLNQEEVMTAPEMFDKFRQTYLKPYLQIIENSPVYPLITDANGVVLSLPPIINGDHSKITLNTKNIFIEITAKDREKAKVVLDTLCSMFSEYCDEKFTCEAVDVCFSDGTITSPAMGYRTETCSAKEVCLKSGITDLSAEEISNLLSRMYLPSKCHGDDISVEVGPTRHDILHQCDIEEDVAIAYGFNNIKKQIPDIYTVGTEQEVNKLTDCVREEIARAGFTEVLTFSLCSREDISTNLRTPEVLDKAVKISNPKTFEFQVVRTQLLPGILKTVSCNRKMPLPLKLFEVSDVVLKDPQADTHSKNYRHICALYCGKSSGFEVVHGLLDRLMLVLNEKDYSIEQSSDPIFFSGRGADVLLGSRKIGHLGILHPEVLDKFDVTLPCSVLEINLEPLI